MRVAVVHGYFLADSGSGAYVRQLTKELVRQGHDVTLVCQERRPELYDFIDTVCVLDRENQAMVPCGEAREHLYAGGCRFVRPELGGRLLVYVDGPFPGFARGGIKAFQDAPQEWIDAYISDNVAALKTTFAEWCPDVVLANHAMMQPVIVRRALEALGVETPYLVTVHGSELNFSVKVDPRLVPYTLEGLGPAAAVVAVSEHSCDDVVAWSRENGLDLAEKTLTLAPGIDTELFAPAATREDAVHLLAEDVQFPAGFDLEPTDTILGFAGRLMWTKGIQHAVAAMPIVSAAMGRTRLLVAGEGPAHGPLEQLIGALQEGDVEEARALVDADEELKTVAEEFGPVIPDDIAVGGDWKVAFLGHLSSAKVARVFAAADASLAPSVFAEAVGLVTVEALSAGALPVVACHTGLETVIDVVADELEDLGFRQASPPCELTESLASMIVRGLRQYPTTDPAFRQRLHQLAAERFPSWSSVAARYLELAGDD